MFVPPDKIPTLFFTVGLPGSGKTTLCERLAREAGVVHLSRDEVRKKFGAYESRKEAYVLSHLMAEAKGRLLDHQDVVVDATNLTVAHRARICSWAYDLFVLHNFRTRKVALVLPCDVETSITRRKEEITEKSVRNMAQQYVPPDAKREGFPVILCRGSALELDLGEILGSPAGSEPARGAMPK